MTTGFAEVKKGFRENYDEIWLIDSVRKLFNPRLPNLEFDEEFEYKGIKCKINIFKLFRTLRIKAEYDKYCLICEIVNPYSKENERVVCEYVNGSVPEDFLLYDAVKHYIDYKMNSSISYYCILPFIKYVDKFDCFVNTAVVNRGKGYFGYKVKIDGNTLVANKLYDEIQQVDMATEIEGIKSNFDGLERDSIINHVRDLFDPSIPDLEFDEVFKYDDVEVKTNVLKLFNTIRLRMEYTKSTFICEIINPYAGESEHVKCECLTDSKSEGDTLWSIVYQYVQDRMKYSAGCCRAVGYIEYIDEFKCYINTAIDEEGHYTRKHKRVDGATFTCPV